MTQRTRISLLAAAVSIALGAAPAVALAGSGFTVPSGNTICGLLTAKQAEGGGAGLYCSSRYVHVPNPANDLGGAKLLHSGKGRKIGLGNDSALRIEGDFPTAPRPTLGYGKTWRRDGYTCVSRSTGLTCTRGSHGFFLSRAKQTYF